MPEQRYLIRGGTVLTMDPAIGDLESADVLVEGTRIAAVAPDLTSASTGPSDAGPIGAESIDAEVIDATGCVVLPGFVDTHHHQYQTALRGTLSGGLLAEYLELVHARVSPVYRPQDVRIAELVASLSQLDAGVTTGVDTSQVSNSPEHSDAAIDGLRAAGRRTVFAYAPATTGPARDAFPGDLERLLAQYFGSAEQLITPALLAEMMPGFRAHWALAREFGVPIASHVVGASEAIVTLGREGLLGPDNEYIHATRLSPEAWSAIVDSGGGVSIAAPIEMTMNHGIPPIVTALEHGIEPSLSTDVECTMAADMFTQLRSVYTLQRALVNERIEAGTANRDDLLTPADVLRFATVAGARVAHLADRIGTLTPGKQADIVLLRADALNVMPRGDAAGAVVTLMDRSNVDTVLVAGTIRKRAGTLLDVDLPALRAELESSRDHLLAAAG